MMIMMMMIIIMLIELHLFNYIELRLLLFYSSIYANVYYMCKYYQDYIFLFVVKEKAAGVHKSRDLYCRGK
jgi:hypothetical protein